MPNQENTRESALKITIENENRRKTDPHDSREKSLIIVGGKEVGKTTMIYRFLEKEDTPKPTLAIDYSYGRKAGKSLVKDIVHVWEIGHLTPSLLASAMSGCLLSHSPYHTTIIIMLNLGKPETLWNSLEECLDALRSAMKLSYSSELMNDMLEQKKKSLGIEGTGDRGEILATRACIIAGKYDEFKDFDAEDKELVGQTLRAVAHALGASLHYHSAKDSQLLRKTKELLSYYGFKGQSNVEPRKSSQTNNEKPLSVSAGSDSFDAIGLKYRHDKLATSLDEIKRIYVTRFPQIESEKQRSRRDSRPESSYIEHSAADHPNFNEPIIDRLRSQRQQEISLLLRDMIETPTTSIPVPEPY